MSLKNALYSYLSGVAGVTAVVSNRIYPDMAPPNAAKPYIVFRIISASHVRYMTDPSNFCWRRVQFDAYGASSVEVEQIFSALRTALESKVGSIGTTPNTATILSSGIDSEREDYIAPTDGSQIGTHRRSIDFIIWHRL